MTDTQGHIPVMMTSVLETLAPQGGDTIVDGTFGGGGYTKHILKSADCKVIGIDRDPDAVTRGRKLEQENPNFKMIEGRFGDLENLLAENDIGRVDGFVLDIGVSSFQLDQAERGFSFIQDGPLDMRMSQSGESAADIVNTYGEKEIADILYRYGDERKSRRIASRIVERRKEEPFKTTLDLANLIENTIGRKRKPTDAHPATRSFQALRIAVNDEMGELERALEGAISILKPGGRLVVVSFHSTEDRIVKKFLREKSGDIPRGSRHLPVQRQEKSLYWFNCPDRRARAPSDQEIKDNIRARSAKLRYGIRTDHETE